MIVWWYDVRRVMCGLCGKWVLVSGGSSGIGVVMV